MTNGDQTQLIPHSEDAAKECCINGHSLTGTAPVTLKPNDRIIFGNGTVFLYRCQGRDAEVELRDTPENPITYEYAMSERAKIENAEEEERRQRERAEQEAAAAAQMEELRLKMEKEKAE